MWPWVSTQVSVSVKWEDNSNNCIRLLCRLDKIIYSNFLAYNKHAVNINHYCYCYQFHFFPSVSSTILQGKLSSFVESGIQLVRAFVKNFCFWPSERPYFTWLYYVPGGIPETWGYTALPAFIVMEWLDHAIGVRWLYKKPLNSSPKWLHHFTFPPVVCESSSSLHPCHNFSQFSKCVMDLMVFLVCISLMINDVKHHFRCLPFIYFGELSVPNICPYFNWVCSSSPLCFCE